MQKLDMNDWIRLSAGRLSLPAETEEAQQETPKKIPPAHAGAGLAGGMPYVRPSMNEFIRSARRGNTWTMRHG